MDGIGLTTREKQASHLGIESTRKLSKLLHSDIEKRISLKMYTDLTARIARSTGCRDSDLVQWYPEFSDASTASMITYALANIEQLRVLPEYLRSFEDSTTQIISWARVLPCSWESPRFMREHHESLFNAEVMTADEAICEDVKNAYNSYGEAAQKRFEMESRKANVAFDLLMFESDFRRIADPDSIEHFRCTKKSRLETVQRAQGILDAAEAYNSRLWLVTPDDEKKLQNWNKRWHPKKMQWDTLVLVRGEGGLSLFAFWRFYPNTMTHMSVSREDLDLVSQFISEAEGCATMDLAYTRGVAEEVRRSIAGRKPFEYP
jgi:hypothetical protein